MRSAPYLVTLALLACALAPLGARAQSAAPEDAVPTLAEPSAAAEPDAAAASDEGDVAEDYDPWQRFNEPMFTFNHSVLDRFVVKPAATGWDKVLPDAAQRGLGRAFDNLSMPRRLVNNLLQLRPLDAGGELARFLINTTVGFVGVFDVAKTLHLEKSDADMGQTLGVYGIGPGPYLVLPFLHPLTVRDGIGRGVDGALDPFGYLIPFAAGTVMSVVNAVNERSLNLKLFGDVEESVFDLYSAVRNGYLQRRQSAIEERRAARHAPEDKALTQTHPAPPPTAAPPSDGEDT
jgi:phospholipid-binding lipoprotein MlaA